MHPNIKQTHLKTRMQHDNMKLHAKSSKFHIEHTQRSNGSIHTLHTSHNNNLSITATRHLVSIQTTCYNILTWKQNAWTWCTGKAQQNMNTDLSPEITRTCSKGHGKIANNNSFTDTAEITGHGRNNIRLQSLELSNNMLHEHIIAKKGMTWIY